jgi:hypothetical protein
VVIDELLGGPACSANAATEVVQGLVREVNLEWVDVDAGLDGGAHVDLSRIESPCYLTRRPPRTACPFDDVAGELGRTTAADVLHRVDRFGRHEQELACVEGRRLLAFQVVLQGAFENVDDLFARMLVLDEGRFGPMSLMVSAGWRWPPLCPVTSSTLLPSVTRRTSIPLSS